MANVLYEGRRTGAYLISDDIHLSRESVTFAAGDQVEAGTVMAKLVGNGQYVPLNPTATDGSEVASAIAYDNVEPSSTPRRAVVTLRQTAVKASELIWPKKITTEQRQKAIDALALATIILR
ncbi:head decoration protein [Bartonella sp. DGB2]|uniref:head decoration protein n=1 Tax=Bartonella sp. DGB2 TaxID=3388426 RepID=UPI00398FEE9F